MLCICICYILLLLDMYIYIYIHVYVCVCMQIYMYIICILYVIVCIFKCISYKVSNTYNIYIYSGRHSLRRYFVLFCIRGGRDLLSATHGRYFLLLNFSHLEPLC